MSSWAGELDGDVATATATATGADLRHAASNIDDAESRIRRLQQRLHTPVAAAAKPRPAPTPPAPASAQKSSPHLPHGLVPPESPAKAATPAPVHIGAALSAYTPSAAQQSAYSPGSPALSPPPAWTPNSTRSAAARPSTAPRLSGALTSARALELPGGGEPAAAAAAAAAYAHGGGREPAAAELLFRALDANGDGVITKQEMRAGLAHPVAAPPVASSPARSEADAFSAAPRTTAAGLSAEPWERGRVDAGTPSRLPRHSPDVVPRPATLPRTAPVLRTRDADLPRRSFDRTWDQDGRSPAHSPSLRAAGHSLHSGGAGSLGDTGTLPEPPPGGEGQGGLLGRIDHALERSARLSEKIARLQKRVFVFARNGT